MRKKHFSLVVDKGFNACAEAARATLSSRSTCAVRRGGPSRRCGCCRLAASPCLDTRRTSPLAQRIGRGVAPVTNGDIERARAVAVRRTSVGPTLMSARTASAHPVCAAKCSGVLPAMFPAFGSVPPATSATMVSTSPRAAASRNRQARSPYAALPTCGGMLQGAWHGAPARARRRSERFGTPSEATCAPPPRRGRAAAHRPELRLRLPCLRQKRTDARRTTLLAGSSPLAPVLRAPSSESVASDASRQRAPAR